MSSPKPRTDSERHQEMVIGSKEGNLFSSVGFVTSDPTRTWVILS
jgi:hypothetical protein